jgi:hypothetical protein
MSITMFQSRRMALSDVNNAVPESLSTSVLFHIKNNSTLTMPF